MDAAAGGSGPAVRAAALTIVRGGTAVIDGVDLELAAGEVTGLLGPSGCGKTTLMRAVVGTQRVTSGRLEVLGRRAGDPRLRHQVGYASQQASVYDDLTVAQNVAYFAAMLGAPRDHVTRVIDQVDLGRLTGRLAGRLSGGERSRVSLAVAMLGRPRLLVLDEPTVGLDPVLREDLWRLFGELAGAGMALLVSSHVMDEAQRCDRLVLLRSGRVLTRATPGELMQRTATTTMDAAFLHLVREREAAG